jgi:hypothetical protein
MNTGEYFYYLPKLTFEVLLGPLIDLVTQPASSSTQDSRGLQINSCGRKPGCPAA